MPTDMTQAIVRVLGPNGTVVGTGMVVSSNGLIATCAHVVEIAEAEPGVCVTVMSYTMREKRVAYVVPEWWRPSDAEDVAILRIEGPLPPGVTSLSLGSAINTVGHNFWTFGYPSMGDYQGIPASGTIDGFAHKADGQQMLQLLSSNLAQGHSGAPVFDLERGQVVGMVSEIYHPGHTTKHRDTAFAIPSDELVKICPELELCAPPALSLGRLYNVPSLPPHFLARPEDLASVKKALLTSAEDSVVITGVSQKVGVHGMGGIGKTVLATALARDEEVQQAFLDGVLWLTLGQNPWLTLRQSDLCRALGDPPQHFDDVQQGKARLSELLADKACLLILDDVWDARHAGAFDALGSRCRMLVTTRDAALITNLGVVPHIIDMLDEDQAFQLLVEWARQDVETLSPEIHEVVQECGCLPLALAMVGAMVQGKPDRWRNILHRLQNADLSKIRRQFPNYPYPDLLRTIQVSVDTLEREIQARYLDLAIFPENIPIPEATLATFWAQEGLDKFDVQDVIDTLVDRSLARRDYPGCINLHDLQHDYVRRQIDQLSITHVRFIEAHRPKSGSWSDLSQDDPYLWDHLGTHLLEAGKEKELRNLLLSPNWFQAQQAHNPSLRIYTWDVDRVLSEATTRDLDGLPDLLVYGLLRGTLTTYVYRLTAEQAKQLIDNHQVDLLLEWSEGLPSQEWFKVDLIQAAAEVSALDGQRDKAIQLLREAANQVLELLSPTPFRHLTSITGDLLMLDDRKGLELVHAISEQIPESILDRIVNQRSRTTTLLQQLLQQMEAGIPGSSILQRFELESNGALKRLTDESYMTGGSKARLYAAQQASATWATWAELLNRCGSPNRSQIAYARALYASRLIEAKTRDERYRVWARLAEVAANLSRPSCDVENLLDEAIGFIDEIPDVHSPLYSKAHLAEVSIKLGYPGRAIQLLEQIVETLKLDDLSRRYEKAIILARLFPFVSLLPNCEPFVSWVEDETHREIVALTFQAYCGDSKAVETLLDKAETIEDRSDTCAYLIHSSLQAMIPFVKMEIESPRLLQRWLAACHRVAEPANWLCWVRKIVPPDGLGKEISEGIARTLTDTYEDLPCGSRLYVVPEIALTLACLPITDREWAVSLFHDVFFKERPYHRSVVLYAIERFAPLLFALGGPKVIVETWDRIRFVERLFEWD